MMAELETDLKADLITFLNGHVKEYETNVFVSGPEGFRPISKEEHTPFVVDSLLLRLEDHFGFFKTKGWNEHEKVSEF
jgi:hypothetical protein